MQLSSLTTFSINFFSLVTEDTNFNIKNIDKITNNNNFTK